jgi:hypothetical protein
MSIPAIAAVSTVGPSTSVSVTESIAQLQSQLNQLEQAETSQSNVETRAQLAFAVEQVEAQPKPAETVQAQPSAPAPDGAPANSAAATASPTSESGPTLNALA